MPPKSGPELLEYRIKLGLIRLRYRRNEVDPSADTPARTGYRSAYEARKARYLAQGLTSKGKPRSTANQKRTSAAKRAAQQRASYLRRRERFAAMGLNSSGAPRRREWRHALVTVLGHDGIGAGLAGVAILAVTEHRRPPVDCMSQEPSAAPRRARAATA